MAGQKIANAPLGSFLVKTIYTDIGEAVQEISTAPVLSIRVDDTGTYQYFGWASVGADESEGQWRVARWTVANVNKLLWADGNTLFDNSWTNRATLNYS